MDRARKLIAISLLFLLPGTLMAFSNANRPPSAIETFAKKYVDTLVRFNPVYGTAIGIHAGDDRLPDFSPGGWKMYLGWLSELEAELLGIPTPGMAREDQIDRRILLNHIRLERLGIEELGVPVDPRTYSETVGDGLVKLIARDFAPAKDRLKSLAGRCEETPIFLDRAKMMLSPESVQPTQVQKVLAISGLEGMIEKDNLFMKVLPEFIASTPVDWKAKKAALESCERAAASVKAFANWLKETVAPRPDGEWRLGRELYEKKYALYMDYPQSPEELLATAEKELDAHRAEFVETGRKIHDGFLADGIDAGKIKAAADLNDHQVLADIFAKLAADSPTAETIIPDSYKLADLIRGFVEKKGLMSLPASARLRIEDVPPHMRGQAVAQIDTAPPFQPELDSIWYWDLGLLKSMPGFLKEYSRPMLAEVYIHEGVPGHFVQLWYSNKFPRITPKVFYNNAMVEGWAMFIQREMREEGFTVYPDHPFGRDIQKLGNLKSLLRGVINCIIDIRLHAMDMPEEEALRLMVEQGLQEEAEAKGKIKRAQRSSVQLTTYFAGYNAILQILGEYKEKKGEPV